MKKFGVPLRSSQARQANFTTMGPGSETSSSSVGPELRLSRRAGNANAIRSTCNSFRGIEPATEAVTGHAESDKAAAAASVQHCLEF